MIGLMYAITHQYKLGIPLGAYDTLELHLVDWADDGILHI